MLAHDGTKTVVEGDLVRSLECCQYREHLLELGWFHHDLTPRLVVVFDVLDVKQNLNDELLPSWHVIGQVLEAQCVVIIELVVCHLLAEDLH